MKGVRAGLFSSLLILNLLVPCMAFAQSGETLAIQSMKPEALERLNQAKAQMRKGATFTVGYSSALERDLSELTGLREPKGWLKKAQSKLRAPDLSVQTLPSSYDWREVGPGLPPVRNQGSCGSCWAFGTVGPLEAQIFQQSGVAVDLSEQYLVSCNMDGWGCNGGWWAHDYHMDTAVAGEQPGAVLESVSPYTAQNGTCAGPYNHPYRISDWNYVNNSMVVPTVQEIKNAIITYGPVGAAVYASPAFMGYAGGIFNANETGKVNHAIVLVGWVDDGPGTGYWILRNSWGASWGDHGYMNIRYNSNSVGYAANYIDFTYNGTPPPVVEQKPDLGGSFTSLYTANAGRTVKGTARITNSGDAASSSFKVILSLSTNGVDKTQTVGTTTVTKILNPTQVVVISINKAYTTSVRGKYLIMDIDADGVISEKNETNNRVVQKIP
jgi:C1A family cysteine protease